MSNFSIYDLYVMKQKMRNLLMIRVMSRAGFNNRTKDLMLATCFYILNMSNKTCINRNHL